jgi:tRNA A37 threonylcarbamoyladenosine modification protein TsaB
MALAKGLAAGLGRPLVGVPSLVAWLDAEPDAVAAVARAGAREAYLLIRDAGEIQVLDREALSSAPGPLVAAGELASSFGLTDARSPRAAAAIARRAAERLAGEPGGDDVRSLEPLYLRPPRGLTPAASGAG